MAGEEGTFGFLAGDQLILSVHSATMLTCCSTTQVKKKNDDCLLMQSRLKNIFLRRCLADESSGRGIIMKCKMGMLAKPHENGSVSRRPCKNIKLKLSKIFQEVHNFACIPR